MLAVPAAAYRRLRSSVGFGSATWPTQWIGHRYQVWSQRNLGTHQRSAAPIRVTDQRPIQTPNPMMTIDIAITVRSTVSHVGNAEGCSSIVPRLLSRAHYGPGQRRRR
jgi:hypothetical protein